jgi:hypothetical protein
MATCNEGGQVQGLRCGGSKRVTVPIPGVPLEAQQDDTVRKTIPCPGCEDCIPVLIFGHEGQVERCSRHGSQFLLPQVSDGDVGFTVCLACLENEGTLSEHGKRELERKRNEETPDQARRRRWTMALSGFASDLLDLPFRLPSLTPEQRREHVDGLLNETLDELEAGR